MPREPYQFDEKIKPQEQYLFNNVIMKEILSFTG